MNESLPQSIRFTLVAILASSLTACSGDAEEPTGPEPDTESQVITVEVRPDSARLEALGDTLRFTATARDQNGQVIPSVNVTWSVNPDTIASIEDEGTATARANGAAEVVVEASGVADTALLIVEQQVASVEVSPDSIRSKVIGSVIEFEATARDRNGHPVRAADATWFSSDSTVAVVEDDGTATTTGEGTASITASAGDVQGSARLVVRLPPDRLVRDFAGPTGVHHPPKLDVAASSRRVIAGSSGFQLTLYSASGAELDFAHTGHIFDGNVPGGKPRIVFDPDAERFLIVGETGPASEDTPGRFILLVSTSPDPSDFSPQSWHRFLFEADHELPEFSEVHPARPRIAVSRDAVVLESLMTRVPRPDEACFTRLLILDKEELLAGNASDKTEIDVGDSPEEHCPDLLPIKFSDQAPLFLNVPRVTNAECGLEIWGIKDPLGSPSLRRTRVSGDPEVAVEAFCGDRPPHAPQPDTHQELLTGTGFMITAQPIVTGSDLWMAGTVPVETDDGVRSGIRWIQLDVGAWPASVQVRSSGRFSSEHYAFYPAIAGDDAGGFAVVYGRSSEEEYPSLHYRYHDGAWPEDSISAPQALQEGKASLTAGETTDGRARYGDWFGASLDPIDQSAWLIGEYVIDEETWGAWVGNVAL